MNIFQRALTALLFVLPLSVSAADDLYRVELLIFEQSPVSGDNEIWPSEADRPQLGGTTRINPNQNLLPLPADEAEFGRIITALQRSSIYQPLWHAVWMQPGWDKELAKTIRIEVTAKDELPVEVNSDTATTASYPNQPPAWLALGEPTTAPDQLLAGTVTISRARYLHAALDLVYQESATDTDTDKASEASTPSNPLWTVDAPVTLDKPVPIRLVQSRRMRSKELHYIDNPRLGALIKITPVEAPEGQETTPGSTSSN